MSRKFAHMENGYPAWRKLQLTKKKCVVEEFESTDSEYAYRQQRKEDKEAKIRERNDRVFPGLKQRPMPDGDLPARIPPVVAKRLQRVQSGGSRKFGIIING